MICNNCGKQNVDGATFCSVCGNKLVNNLNGNMNQTSDTNSVQVQGEAVNNTAVQNVSNVLPNSQVNTTVNQNLNTSNAPQVDNNKLSISKIFFIIIAILIKPYTAFKEELEKFSKFTNSLILSIFISAIATIVYLISTMISVVRVKGYSETSWKWENLKYIPYFKTILTMFFGLIGILLVIAAIYYIASLIAKKQANFSKLFAISSFAIVPTILATLVLAPILSSINTSVGMAVGIAGALYSLIINYEGMNSEIKVEGNARYYLNTICILIIILSLYFIAINVVVGAVNSSLSTSSFWGIN